MAARTSKQIAFDIINSYIQEIREYGNNSYGSVDKYDAAVTMALMTKVITPTEKKKFDQLVNDLID